MAITKLQPFNLDSTANYTFANITTTNANLGNVATANFFIGSGNNLSNIQGSNITGVVSSATTAGTVTTGAQPNITSTGTLTSVSVSGNANVGNIGTTNLVATGTGSFGANVNMNTYWINNVGYPSLATDAATKSYVDTMVSSGISYHQPVAVSTTTTLAVATGGTTAYNSPNGAANGIGAYISTTGTYLNIDGANVQTVGTRILVKDEANATWNGVYTYANTTAIVRSTDTDEYGPDSTTQLSINDYFFTQGGTVNKGIAFIVSAPTGTITFGTSNITFAQFSTSQVYTAGTGIAITGTVISANASQTQITAVGTLTTLSVSGNATVGNLIASGGGGGNITGANLVSANYFTGTLTTAAQPNITSTGTLTSLSVSGNANIGNIGTAGLITITGNLNAGNLITGGIVSATGNGSFANVNAGNLLTANYTTAVITTGAQPNITSTGTLTSVSSSGNVTGANLITGGIVSATGNITASFFIGNGSQLTGLNTAGVSNGNSNVNIATANGNVTIASAGNTTMTITGTGANISGTLSATANITGGNLITAGIVSATGNGSFGNANLGNLATANFFTGTLTTAAQPNITGTGTLASLSVSGTSNLGNVGNVKITGGTNGQVLSTDGAGNLTFADTASGNSTAPMPYLVSVGESYMVPNNFQGLFTVPITIDGELEVDGILVEVGTAINSLNSQIIFDDNGELTGNTGFTFDAVSGNLAVPGSATVSSILTNNYYYANGQPLSFGGAPGGSTTQLQYNNAGSFGGISTATYSGGKLSLGSNAEVKITGGTNGQVLSTDGAGNLSWANGGGSTGFLSITSRSGIIEVNIIGGYLNIVGRSGTIPIPIS